jgi:hypothetical protein
MAQSLEINMNKTGSTIAAITHALLLSTGLMGCKDKGPVEQAGETIDETVDTIKNGGKESTATKLDNAADDVRDGVKDAAKEVSGK